jgi:hypothetical protein
LEMVKPSFGTLEASALRLSKFSDIQSQILECGYTSPRRGRGSKCALTVLLLLAVNSVARCLKSITLNVGTAKMSQCCAFTRQHKHKFPPATISEVRLSIVLPRWSTVRLYKEAC